MAESNSEKVNKDLEDVGARLKSLNARIRDLSSSNGAEKKPSQYSAQDTKNLSIEEMRNKLRTINQYLRKKLDHEEMAKDEEAAQEEALERERLVKEKEAAERASREAAEKARLEGEAAAHERTAREEAARARVAREVVFKRTVAKEIVSEKMEEPILHHSDTAASVAPKEQITSVDLPRQGDVIQSEVHQRLGVGLDVGTAYLVASREIEGTKVFVKTERNAFLSIRGDQSTKDFLAELKIKCVSLGSNMFVLGNLAHKFANILNTEVKRTMSMGILNPSEAESISIIKLIVQNILWEPRQKGEVCCFSVPANPVDRNQDTIYHSSVFEGILRSLGFDALVIDEGYAVVLSELEYKNYTGIGVSCGGGMVNVCAAYRTVPLISFSMTRGGDWIDQSAAKVLNIPITHITTIKEQGMNLKNPKTREEEAIAIYYRNYIRYFLEHMAQVFTTSKETSQLKEPIDIVFAGGSSMVGGFLEVVKEELQTVSLGISVGDVKLSDDPFTSVVRGCLFQAINTQESKTEAVSK
ncbi:MAG: hypothetical protein HQL15_02945 [Candidatus Omnitrophica bacterium]|nr:hypothetical protein [Candidatus Omnitrophota bacterium]